MDNLNNTNVTETMSLQSFFTPTGKGYKEPLQKAFGQLGINTLSKMIDNLQQGKRICFDAHTKAYDCERVALGIYQLTSSYEIQKKLIFLKNSIRENPNNIHIDQKIQFLVGAYFLGYLHVVFENINQVETSTCKAAKIDDLAKNIPKTEKSEIIEQIQVRLSKMSAQFIEEESKHLSPYIRNVKKIQEMSLVENLKFKDNRYFSSEFYLLKLTLFRLREIQAPILIKKMVKKGKKSFGFLCQPENKSEDFQPLSSLPPKTSTVIVFKGSVQPHLNRQGLIDAFVKYGITSVLLCMDAMREHESQDDEILDFKQNASSFGCTSKENSLFILYHVYCSSLEEEELEGVVYDK